MVEYQVERDVCEKQVLEAVQSLAQEKLVTVSASWRLPWVLVANLALFGEW